MDTARTRPQNAAELQKHVMGTYLSLRLGLVVLAVALPAVLAAGGWWLGIPLQDSLSTYFHTGMRDWFVGILWAAGGFLYLYKGFGRRENRALNVAGVAAVCVAMFPVAPPGVPPRLLSAHGVSAVLFFLAVAYVCLFRSSDTLRLIADPRRAERFRRTYRAMGAVLVLAPVAAYLLTLFLRGSWMLFAVETAGVLAFALYWTAKSREMAETHAELLLAGGEAEADRSGKVVPREPARGPAPGAAEPVPAPAPP